MAKTDKNYYDILGVDKSASQDDIKKAYKRLTLKYHPDKQAGKSDKEKDEAEQKFIEINEAYQVLSDETKRQNYDHFGDPDMGFGPDVFSGMGGMGFNPFNPFGGFAGGGGFSKDEPVIPGKDIRMNIPLTIEEIFSGTKKTLRYEKNVRCAVCHGDGGTGKRMCTVCGGTGMELSVQHTPFGMIRQQTTCHYCHGTGQVVEKSCTTCNGTGFTKMKDTVEVDIPAGIQNGQGILIRGKGSESKSRKGANGNVIIVASHNYDTEKYIVEGNDIIEIVKLPYYDLLLGTEYKHTFPDGRTKKINIAPCSPDSKIIRLYHEGINNEGDYFLQLKYITPDELSDAERKALETIKVERTKENLKSNK